MTLSNFRTAEFSCRLTRFPENHSILKGAVCLTLLTITWALFVLFFVTISGTSLPPFEMFEPFRLLEFVFVAVLLAPAFETVLLVLLVKLLRYITNRAWLITLLVATFFTYLHFRTHVIDSLIVFGPFLIWTWVYSNNVERNSDKTWKMVFFSHVLHNAVAGLGLVMA